jgi:TRAP-type C4-dicarboxylate transport system permease small subunit
VIALWDRYERRVIGVLGAFALMIGTYQIAGRYINPEFAAPWASELGVYVVVWAVFIAGSNLVATDSHVRPDLVLRMLSPHARRVVEIGNSVCALAFCAGLVWYGALIVADALEFNERSLSPLAFPMAIYYAALPLGTLLMSVRYVLRLYRLLFHFVAEDAALLPLSHE